MTGFDCYKRYGMSNGWLQDFLSDPRDWPDGTSLGTSQVTGMRAWLDHAGLRLGRDGTATDLGELLSRAGTDASVTWCVIWSELCMRSSLIALYLRTVPPGTSASRQALLDALEQQIGHRTAENALVSLANTLDCTPLGADLGLGIVTRKGNACVEITREKRVSVPPEALLYALYRYAETMDQYALSLDQIANDTEAGPAHWFGSNAADLDAALRGLSSQHPSLLRTEFARGLDSVFLAPELSAVDALRAVVR